MRLVKNVVQRTHRFRLHRADGTPSEIIVAVRAESEDAARLRLPQNEQQNRDWRLIEVANDG